MDDEEKEIVSRFNNFFCGFYGFVYMVNVVQKGLYEGEVGNFVGNFLVFDKMFFKSDEFGCFCLIRSVCKVFVRRGDEKCGCYGVF